MRLKNINYKYFLKVASSVIVVGGLSGCYHNSNVVNIEGNNNKVSIGSSNNAVTIVDDNNVVNIEKNNNDVDITDSKVTINGETYTTNGKHR